MVTGTHTQSLLGTFRCAAGGNREDCRRSRRIRHRGVLFQGRIVRHRTCTERRRIRYLPAARPHGGMGGRCGGTVFRTAYQYGAGAAVHHPHEDSPMCRSTVRFALYSLPVVPVRFPGTL